MKLYGIKNCDSVKKAIKFLNEHNIEYQFVDLKSQTIECDTINHWLKSVEMKKLFNSRSTTYRNLKLKELNLDDTAKIEWLCKEPMLIKRPVIELKSDSTVVGFNQDEYNQKLL